MLPTLSAENRLKRKLLDLDCSAGFLAALDSSISDSRLSQALRGIKQLENRDAERLLELCDRCIELRDSLEPIPVSFAEPTKIRVVLNNLAVSHEEIQRTIASLFVECK